MVTGANKGNKGRHTWLQLVTALHPDSDGVSASQAMNLPTHQWCGHNFCELYCPKEWLGLDAQALGSNLSVKKGTTNGHEEKRNRMVLLWSYM